MSLKEKPPRLTVYLPETAKRELEQMAEDTGFSQTQLVVMATHSLLVNYKTKGSAIFSELMGIGSNSSEQKLQKKE